MPRFISLLERPLARVEDAFAWAAIAILVFVSLAVCVDVGLRYAFNRPLYWVTETAEYALVYITFLGAAWAIPRRGHVNVDVFVVMMPHWAQTACAVMSNLVGFGISLALVVFGSTMTYGAFMRGLFKPTLLAVPTWIVIIIIPIGGAILLLRFFVEVLKSAQGGNAPAPATAPPFSGVE